MVRDIDDLRQGCNDAARLAGRGTGEKDRTNTATVSATEVDPNPADDTATVATQGLTPENCSNCIDDDGNGRSSSTRPPASSTRR